jgi:peptide/nickel transport system substrate-binding protein
VGLLAAAMIAGLGTATAEAQTKHAALLQVAWQNAPSSLDPYKAVIDPFGSEYLSLTYEPLMRFTSDGKFEAGLAESWGYTDKANRVFQFKLRDGAKFADGTAVDAKSVVASLKYFRASAAYKSLLEACADMAAVDALTVKITCTEPQPIMASILSSQIFAGYIISPAGLADTQKLLSGSYGAGAYVLDTANTVPGNIYVFKANPNYWDKAHQFYDQVRVTVIADRAASVKAVQTGQQAMGSGSAATVADAARQAGLGLAIGPIGAISWTIADRNGELVPALKDVRVRQALNYAIDRVAINKAIQGEWGEAGAVPLHKDELGYDKSLDDFYAYDPAKAKKLLADAGYPNGFDLGEVITQTPTDRAEAVIASWAAIGVKAKLVSFPNTAAFLPQVLAKKYALPYSPFNVAPTYQTSLQWLLPTVGRYNPWGIGDKAITDLVDQAAAAPEKDQQALYQKAWRMALEQGWWVTLFRTNYAHFYDKAKVGGVTSNTFAQDLTRLHPL